MYNDIISPYKTISLIAKSLKTSKMHTGCKKKKPKDVKVKIRQAFCTTDLSDYLLNDHKIFWVCYETTS